jgi:hypothetical protein
MPDRRVCGRDPRSHRCRRCNPRSTGSPGRGSQRSRPPTATAGGRWRNGSILCGGRVPGGLDHVADRFDLAGRQPPWLGARTTGSIVERADVIGPNPRAGSGRRQSENSQRRRQRHASPGTLDRAKQAALAGGIRHAREFELETGHAQQGEDEPQDRREHGDPPFEPGRHGCAKRARPSSPRSSETTCPRPRRIQLTAVAEGSPTPATGRDPPRGRSAP